MFYCFSNQHNFIFQQPKTILVILATHVSGCIFRSPLFLNFKQIFVSWNFLRVQCALSSLYEEIKLNQHFKLKGLICCISLITVCGMVSKTPLSQTKNNLMLLLPLFLHIAIDLTVSLILIVPVQIVFTDLITPLYVLKEWSIKQNYFDYDTLGKWRWLYNQKNNLTQFTKCNTAC